MPVPICLSCEDDGKYPFLSRLPDSTAGVVSWICEQCSSTAETATDPTKCVRCGSDMFELPTTELVRFPLWWCTSDTCVFECCMDYTDTERAERSGQLTLEGDPA